MKKILSLLSAAVILLQFTSCKKTAGNVFTGIDLTIPDVQVTLPIIVSVSTTEISLGTYSIHYNLDTAIQYYTGSTFNISSVTSVKVKQAILTMQNTDPLNNLSNFESMRIALQSNVNTTPTDILLFTFPDVYASSYTSSAGTTELLPYVKGSDLMFTVYGKMRRVTSKSLTIILSITFHVS